MASRRPSEHKKLLHLPPSTYTECTLPNEKRVLYHATTTRIYGKDLRTLVVLDLSAQKKRVAEFRFKLARKVREINAYFQEEGCLNPATLAGKRGRGQMWLEKAAVVEKISELAGKAPLKGVIKFSVSGPAKLSLRSKRHFALSLAVDAKTRKWHEETLGKSVILDALATMKITKIFPSPKSTPLVKMNETSGLAQKLSKFLNLKRLTSL